MKIGVVTFWETEDNYGQILQCFALQSFLRELGHDAFLIRYKGAERRPIYKKIYAAVKLLFSPLDILLYVKFKRQVRIAKKQNQLYPRHFDNFRREYIHVSHEIYTSELLLSSPPEADAYVCGSDQIWGAPNPFFFLSFGKKGIKKVAYAASFGKTKLSKRMKKKVPSWLSEFDLLTVREDSGVKLCEDLGRFDAKVAIDPTLLLTKENYLERLSVNTQTTPDKYIFLYLLGSDIDIDIKLIYQDASKKGYKVKYVASQGRIDKFDKIYPTVEEWLSLLVNAHYIITNSFHGVAFSVIFNKQFKVIPLSGLFKGMNTRLYSLLNSLNLTDCILKRNCILNEELNHINYDEVNSLVLLKRVDVIKLLVDTFK